MQIYAIYIHSNPASNKCILSPCIWYLYMQTSACILKMHWLSLFLQTLHSPVMIWGNMQGWR